MFYQVHPAGCCPACAGCGQLRAVCLLPPPRAEKGAVGGAPLSAVPIASTLLPLLFSCVPSAQRVVFDYSDMLVGPGNTGGWAAAAAAAAVLCLLLRAAFGRLSGPLSCAEPPAAVAIHPTAAVLERGIAEVARKYNMEWRVSYSTKQKRMALLVRCGGVQEA